MEVLSSDQGCFLSADPSIMDTVNENSSEKREKYSTSPPISTSYDEGLESQVISLIDILSVFPEKVLT